LRAASTRQTTRPFNPVFGFFRLPRLGVCLATVLATLVGTVGLAAAGPAVGATAPAAHRAPVSPAAQSAADPETGAVAPTTPSAGDPAGPTTVQPEGHGKCRRHHKCHPCCIPIPIPIPIPKHPICDRGSRLVAYNDMPYDVVNCLNPAEGFECCQRNEFGDQVTLAGSTTFPGRTLRSLKVLFGSYACQTGGWNTGDCQSAPGSTFAWPITARLYSPSNTTTPLAMVTVTQSIPYRPPTDAVRCPTPGSGATVANRWYNPAAPGPGETHCQNNIATVLTFTFPGNVTLPDSVIWTVAFNTSTSGYNPVHSPCVIANCPYDSLNVGTKSYPNAPYAGTDPNEAEVWTSTAANPALHAEILTPPPPGNTWIGFRPLGEIVTANALTGLLGVDLSDIGNVLGLGLLGDDPPGRRPKIPTG